MDLNYLLNDWFLFNDLSPSLLVSGTHDPWLVVLSVVVAIAASCVALQLAGLARKNLHSSGRYIALITGSFALSAGIWSMHFIGMLAFQLCAEVGYDPALTLASMLPSLAASWVALSLLAQPRIGPWNLVSGGVLVGAGIGAMHYTGMLAMRMAPQLKFDLAWFITSIVVAVALAMLALWIRFGLRQHLRGNRAVLLGGAVMGCAIAGMHYTGMAAARFVGETDPDFVPGLNNNPYLAMGIAVVALSIGALAAAGNALLRYRQLNQQLQDNESRLRAVVETAVDGIISIDRHGHILSFNASAERIFGWRAEEVMGRNIKMLMTDKDAPHHDGYLANYQRTGQAHIIGVGREVMGLHRDGRSIPMRLGIGRTTVAGEPLFVGFLTDVSAQKTMQLALQTREAQFRTLIGNMPGVAFRALTGSHAHMLFVSEAVEALTGLPAAAFMDGDASFAALVHPDDRERVVAEIEQALDRDGAYAVEYRIVRPDGGERWVSETASGVKAPNGTLQSIDGVIMDITESRRRNAEFVGTVNALNRALGVLEARLDGTIVRVNANFAAFTGFEEDELPGQAYLSLYPAGGPAAATPQGLQAALLRGEVVAGEFLARGKQQRDVWLQATHNPIFDAGGRLERFVVFATDITPRKAMERELVAAKTRAEQAAAARSAFLANMSHEIRTPMNAILGFTEVLLGTPLTATQQKHLATVQQAARSLLRLLNDILDTAKLEKGAVQLEAADFSLRELCEQVAASLRLGAEQKGLRFTVDYPNHLPDHFRGDALRVQQVLVNLLGNAVKFTEKGHVKLTVGHEGSSTLLRVEDTGIGIPADRINHIFDAFAQADASITRQFGGTGLGMTIARQLTELMGGRLTVNSEVGVGTRFDVCLPLAPGHPPLPIETQLGGTPGLPPLHVLAVDDVAQNIELLELVLHKHGHQVTVARNGSEAVDRFRDGRFDIVLMDMHMPVMDGLTATRALRALEQQEGRRRTPVIALTASVQAADRFAAGEAGMDGFASKPLVTAQLFAEIARVLDHAAPPTPAVAADTTAEGEHGSDDGIHWQQGLALWQTPERLRVAIAGFVRSSDEVPRMLQDALDRRDLREVAALAHRVSGAAGNLALTRLRAAAQALEQAARATLADGADLTPVTEGAAVLLSQLSATATLATRLEPATAAPAAPADPAQARAALLRLSDALARSALDEAALESLSTLLPASQLARLREAIDGFDFDEALDIAAALRNELEAKP